MNKITSGRIHSLDNARISTLYGGGKDGMPMRSDVPAMSLFQSDDALSSDSQAYALGAIPSVPFQQVLRVVVTNGYECSRCSPGSSATDKGLGLWVVTAFINHSNNPNAEYHASGDTEMMVIRAKKAMTAGMEITVSYVEAPKPGQQKQSLKMWGILDES